MISCYLYGRKISRKNIKKRNVYKRMSTQQHKHKILKTSIYCVQSPYKMDYVYNCNFDLLQHVRALF